MVGAEAGAGAEIFDKLEPHKNGPAPQHCRYHTLEFF
jgi:hypothetical protein